jgi:hypothetical protein
MTPAVRNSASTGNGEGITGFSPTVNRATVTASCRGSPPSPKSASPPLDTACSQASGASAASVTTGPAAAAQMGRERGRRKSIHARRRAHSPENRTTRFRAIVETGRRPQRRRREQDAERVGPRAPGVSNEEWVHRG